MQEVVHPRDVNRARSILWAAFAILAADRIAKMLAALDVTARLLPGVEFRLFRNDGIAFSIPVPDVIFWPIAILALVALIRLWNALREEDEVGAALVIMILLGALSNVADKALTGAITDYIIFFGRSAVNVADGMIVGGTLAMILRKK